jgi:large subunit ribosomal protein L4
MVGGAVSHGPLPRCYEQKVNKKVMKKAIQSIIADKLQAGKLLVVDKIETNGKTKELNKLFIAKNIKSLTMVTDSADSLALRAGRNLTYCTAMPVESFNVYSALRRENIIIEKSALDKLLARIS